MTHYPRDFAPQSDCSVHATTADKLCCAEQLLLWASRSWVAIQLMGEKDLRPIAEPFKLIEAEEVVGYLDDSLGMLFGGLKRKVQVHGPSCPMVSADELTLLVAAGAAQHDAEGEAQRILLTYLRPAAARAVAASLMPLTESMAAFGLVMPQRRMQQTPQPVDAVGVVASGATLH